MERDIGVLGAGDRPPERPALTRSGRASRLVAEQPEEVGRIGENLPRLAEAGGAAELAPGRRGFREVAGGDVVPDLLPFRTRQHVPERLVDPLEALEESCAVLAVPAGRLVEQEDAARAGRAADRLHQAELVGAREVMDRET